MRHLQPIGKGRKNMYLTIMFNDNVLVEYRNSDVIDQEMKHMQSMENGNAIYEHLANTELQEICTI
jgi:hypothetical protein